MEYNTPCRTIFLAATMGKKRKGRERERKKKRKEIPRLPVERAREFQIPEDSLDEAIDC